MVMLKALKPHRYNTRALSAGDVYEAKPKHARLLVAIKKATPAADFSQEVINPAPQSDDHAPVQQRGLDQLRAEAEALGIAVDRRWGTRRLEAEIAAARA